jgi:sugar-specific transcriptional regulator TrmB
MALNQLSQLGLSGKKGRFYLAALELGEAPVTAVAERAGIGRTTAYDILDSLINEGLVTQIEKSGKMYVVAEDPAVFLRNLDRRRRTVEEVLPEIQAIYSHSMFKPRIRYYGGVEGIATVLNDTLSCRSGELRGILSMQELLDAPGEEFMERYIRRRIEAGLKLRVVRSMDEEISNTWPTMPEELRQVRFSPPGVPFTMTSYIYDDKVAYISSRRENFALLIQSAEFAGLQSALFETLWAASSPARIEADPGRGS